MTIPTRRLFYRSLPFPIPRALSDVVSPPVRVILQPATHRFIFLAFARTPSRSLRPPEQRRRNTARSSKSRHRLDAVFPPRRAWGTPRQPDDPSGLETRSHGRPLQLVSGTIPTSPCPRARQDTRDPSGTHDPLNPDLNFRTARTSKPTASPHISSKKRTKVATPTGPNFPRIFIFGQTAESPRNTRAFPDLRRHMLRAAPRRSGPDPR